MGASVAQREQDDRDGVARFARRERGRVELALLFD